MKNIKKIILLLIISIAFWPNILNAATKVTTINGKKLNAAMKSLANGGIKKYIYEDEEIEIIKFDVFDTKKKEQKNFVWKNGIAVDENNNGSIRLFYSNNTIFVLHDSNTITSLNSDLSYLFSYMRLANIVIADNNFDTSSVTNMSYMFERTYIGFNLDFSKWDLSNTTNMSYMFKSADLHIDSSSNLNTSRVTTMQGLFSKAKIHDSKVDFLDTSNVTNMSYMFSNTSVETLDLSLLNTSKVTNMSHMFEGINIYGETPTLTFNKSNNFVTSNVTDMSYMFARLNYNDELMNYCNEINGSCSLKDYYTTVADVVHSNGISGFDTSKVQTMQGMFEQSGLYILNLKSFNVTNLEDTSDMFKNFYISQTLKFGTWKSTKLNDMHGMFNGAYLSSVNLSKITTDNVINMKEMFYNSELKYIDISSWNTSKVKNMSDMFSKSQNLNTIYASSSFTTSEYKNNIKYPNNMFWECNNLVGGNGTKYKSITTGNDLSYAAIDSTSIQGYFTKVVSTPSIKVDKYTGRELKISWNKISNATSYKIYKATTQSGEYKLLSTIDDEFATSYIDSSVEYGKTYYYKLTYYVDSEKKDTSAVVSKKLIPTAPSIKLSSSSYNYNKIAYGKITNVDGYVLYRSDKKDGTYKGIKTLNNETFTYKDTNVVLGKTYYYKVRAYAIVDGKKVYSNYSLILGKTVLPSTVNLTVTKKTSTSVKLSWPKVTGATSYQVYKCTSTSTSSCSKYKSTTNLYMNITGLSKGKKYYYSVRSIRTVNSKKYYGSYSTIKSISL